MSAVEISHVSKFIRFVEELNSKFVRNQHFLYRGESKLNYKLLPSIFRKKEGSFENELYLSKNGERKILNEFMTEAASYINNLSVDDIFRWVQYAQHFGAPTRLMDWTSNPLVALFFACSSSKDEDGRIYILNSHGFHRLTDENDINHMEGKIIKEEAKKMIWELERTFPYPVLFKPYYFDKRMLAQLSQFMVWGYIQKTLKEMVNELEVNGKIKELVKEHDNNEIEIICEEEIDVLSEIQIKGINKVQLQRELDNIGINQSTLFPGLDGIGKSIEWRNNTNN